MRTLFEEKWRRRWLQQRLEGRDNFEQISRENIELKFARIGAMSIGFAYSPILGINKNRNKKFCPDSDF